MSPLGTAGAGGEAALAAGLVAAAELVLAGAVGAAGEIVTAELAGAGAFLSHAVAVVTSAANASAPRKDWGRVVMS